MLVEFMGGETNAEEIISRGAATCYGKNDSSPKRIHKLKQHGHLATMRFGHATFKVSDISRACANQLIRHKFVDVLQESQRYVNQADRGFVMPDVDNESKKMIKEFVELADEVYSHLRRHGVSKEDARSILPQNTMTNIYLTSSFQGWMDMFRLRVSKHAQAEVRQVAIYIWATLSVNFPLVFKDLKFENKSLGEWESTL